MTSNLPTPPAMALNLLQNPTNPYFGMSIKLTQDLNEIHGFLFSFFFTAGISLEQEERKLWGKDETKETGRHVALDRQSARADKA